MKPDDEMGDGPPIVGWADCNQFDLIVFPSEAARVLTLVGGLFFGCVALDPPPVSQAYAYGPNWVVEDGYGESQLEDMEPIAAGLGGLAASVLCADLDPVIDAWEGEWPTEGDPDLIARLKAVLGESDFPGIDPQQFPEAPAASD